MSINVCRSIGAFHSRLVEQDRWAIKRIVRPILGFKSFIINWAREIVAGGAYGD
jgi:hypothetical protein